MQQEPVNSSSFHFTKYFATSFNLSQLKTIIVDKKKLVKTWHDEFTGLWDCTAHKKETYCWFGSAVFAKPCLRYLTSVGLTGATFGSFLTSLSNPILNAYHDWQDFFITIWRKIFLHVVEKRFVVTYLKCHNESQQIWRWFLRFFVVSVDVSLKEVLTQLHMWFVYF